jgi:uncharacterized protein (TIGR03083 family)
VDRIEAARQERAEVLALCRALGDDEWQRPSAAAGWRVQDVVAHMGSSSHALCHPDAFRIFRSTQIERTNDELVADRRSWTPVQTLTEYERWSGRGLAVLSRLSRTPLARLRIPIGELGRFPVGQMVGAAVFDTHCHLRYDIAPALGRQAPATDANRLAIIADWMIAVLGNDLRANRRVWLDRNIVITLTGPGGGTWLIDPDGVVRVGHRGAASAEIIGRAAEFPEWGTTRAPWRERDVTIDGDTDYGVRFLDEMNIV